jgi:hypothetical protein
VRERKRGPKICRMEEEKRKKEGRKDLMKKEFARKRERQT